MRLIRCFILSGQRVSKGPSGRAFNRHSLFLSVTRPVKQIAREKHVPKSFQGSLGVIHHLGASCLVAELAPYPPPPPNDWRNLYIRQRKLTVNDQIWATPNSNRQNHFGDIISQQLLLSFFGFWNRNDASVTVALKNVRHVRNIFECCSPPFTWMPCGGSLVGKESITDVQGIGVCWSAVNLVHRNCKPDI